MTFKQSGFSSRLYKRFRRPVLIAGVLVGGTSLVAGSARATTWDSLCSFGPSLSPTACTGPSGTGWVTLPSPGPIAPGNPPLQLGDKLLNIVSYSFNNFISNSPVIPSGQFNFNWNDAGTPNFFNDDNWSVRTVFDSTVTGNPGTPATGTLNYTLGVVGPTSQFSSVRVDSASTGFGSSVLKTIINPPVSITSVNGGIVDVPLSGIFVDVTDTYSVTNTGGMNSFNNGYQQQDFIPNAPGPLPLLGIGAAFGFSRRLRNRIKGSRLA